jgi:hypothetical protein
MYLVFLFRCAFLFYMSVHPSMASSTMAVVGVNPVMASLFGGEHNDDLARRVRVCRQSGKVRGSHALGGGKWQGQLDCWEEG